jgi:predicted MFS family arabinose efflux permease
MRWIVGTLLACVATLVVAGNLVGGVRARRSGRKFSSVPFVAAVLGSLAVMVLPVENRSWLLLAVLLLDFTVPMAVLALVLNIPHRPPR